MARIEGEIVIGRPANVLFDYVADQSNEPYPYEFVALLIIVVNVSLGSVPGLLPLLVLAICAIWLITQRPLTAAHHNGEARARDRRCRGAAGA